MEFVEVKELIITCESCGSVKKFNVRDEAESQKIFDDFICQNKCGRNLYSFITVGTIKKRE